MLDPNPSNRMRIIVKKIEFKNKITPKSLVKVEVISNGSKVSSDYH
jgi:hypothetical protein